MGEIEREKTLVGFQLTGASENPVLAKFQDRKCSYSPSSIMSLS
ncbi:hypothetical protein AVEN_70607-1, partial [Araneus ventricosus]